MNEIVAPESCTVIRLHGRDGNYKLNNNEIVSVKLAESDTILKIKSHCKGIISFMCKVGDEVKKNDVLCVLNPCPHDIVICGICGLCCASIEITNMGNGDIKCNTGSRMAMVHDNKNLVVNEKTAMELALKDSLNLLKKRKLSLLIDLDLTILHTTSSQVPQELKDVYHYTLRDDQNRHESVNYHTKMRPYLKQFLERMHTKFELHIYTFGNRSYAEKIREFIDPNKVLFGQRIISRDDSFDMQRKTANLKSLFPRGDNMVCIIDDRPEVWNYVPNFIHVKPYIYFPDAGDINNPAEKHKDPTLRGIMNYPPKDPVIVSKEIKEPEHIEDNVSEKKDSEEKEAPIQCSQLNYPDDDDYLLTLENILTEIHNRFYCQYDLISEKFSAKEIVEDTILPDVKKVMKEMRSEVLKGCRIAFSGLIPLNQKVKDTHAYQILKNLGANYFQNVSLPSLKSLDTIDSTVGARYTTHLISHSDGTKKMKQVCHYIKEINKIINEKPAKLSNLVHRVNLVNIYWLWHCYFLWSRVEETQFLFLSNLKQLAPPDGVAEMFYDDDLSQHSSNSGCVKRVHSEDEAEICPKKLRSEAEDEIMKDLKDIDAGSLSDLSNDSHDAESDDSFDMDDLHGPDVVLNYTAEQKMEMWKEIDDAINEEKLEKQKLPSDESSSESSDDDESCGKRLRKKNKSKNWDESVNEEEDSEDSEEHEWDYGDLENNYKMFGKSQSDDSDSEEPSADEDDI